MMARALFAVTLSDGVPVVPAALFNGGDGSGWVRCGQEAGGKCLVMASGAQTVLATMGASLEIVGATAFTETYQTTIPDMERTFAGSAPVGEGMPPSYKLPGVIPTPPEPFPPSMDGLNQLLAAAKFGETVYAPEGTYTGDFTVPAGVTLRPVENARVVIDVLNQFDLSGATVIDIEFTSLNPDRTVIQDGLTMSAVNSHLIGCSVYDVHSSGVNWFSSGAGEITECLFYNNGYRDINQEGHGHNIYSHNNGGGERIVRNNFLLGGMGKYALHIYSGGKNALKDYHAFQNITVNRPTIVGGGLGVSGLVYHDNIQHVNACYIGRYSSNNLDCTVRDNMFTGSAFLEITDFETVIESGNETITDARSVVFPCTQTTRKRAHIAIFNPKRLEAVDVDVSALGLDEGVYTLVNAQNPAESRPITINRAGMMTAPMMDWTAALRYGEPYNARTPTMPVFGTFILR